MVSHMFICTESKSQFAVSAGESPVQLDAAAKVLEMLDAMSDAEPPAQLAERTVERIQNLTSKRNDGDRHGRGPAVT